jgi:hypothetical protein
LSLPIDCGFYVDLFLEQSRRDDLESLGYVLIYFLRGGLPWQNVKAKKKKRRTAIGEAKRGISIEALTQGLPRTLTQSQSQSHSHSHSHSHCHSLILSFFHSFIHLLTHLHSVCV